MWVSWLVTHLGVLKDGVLAIGSVVYLVGYLAWCYYAWRYHIGPVPALQAQYFVAGVFIVGVLSTTACASYMVIRVADIWWPTFLNAQSRARRRALLSGMAALLICAVAAVIFTSASIAARPAWHQTATTLLAVAVLPFVFSALHLAPRLSGGLIRVVLVAYIVLITAGLVLRVVEQWYPEWPQELGGGKPRMASLTLYKTSVGNGGLRFLQNIYNKEMPNSDVIETGPVYVLVRTSDYLIISTAAPNRHSSGRLEVPMKAIAAISWINPDYNLEPPNSR